MAVMNLWDIVRTVGGSIIKEVVPGGGLIVDAVNGFLPKDKKLGAEATGADIEHAISGMSSEDQRKIYEKEFDVDITKIKEGHSTLRTMLESDSRNPHSTRPYIAKHSFHVVAFAVVMTVTLWAYGVAKSDETMVKTIVEGWPFLLAAIAPLAVLLRSYFGVLKVEHRDRLNAADTKPSTPGGLAGLISALVKK